MTHFPEIMAVAEWDGDDDKWKLGSVVKPDVDVLPLLHNVHMGFLESSSAAGGSSSGTNIGGIAAGGTSDITFLFTAVSGCAKRSYGLNVARLARLPAAVIAIAEAKSKEVEAVSGLVTSQ